MGSVSGALAGDAGNSMAVGGDFFWGDSTPIEAAFTFMEPSELDAFLFTVVASALFCLCCRY